MAVQSSAVAAFTIAKDVCAHVHKRRKEHARVWISSRFLSVRVAGEVRDRLKVVAASRGASVQDLVGGLVDRFLLLHAGEAALAA